MKIKKKVLILAYTKLDSDPRPFKQIKLLSKKYDVDSTGLSSSGY